MFIHVSMISYIKKGNFPATCTQKQLRVFFSSMAPGTILPATWRMLHMLHMLWLHIYGYGSIPINTIFR